MLSQDQKLLLSAQRSLLFNITPNVKYIFVEVCYGNRLVMHVYFSETPTSFEKDMFYSVSGEISGDFPEIDDSNTQVKFIVENSNNYEDIKKLKHPVFAQAEKAAVNKNAAPSC